MTAGLFTQTAYTQQKRASIGHGTIVARFILLLGWLQNLLSRQILRRMHINFLTNNTAIAALECLIYN